MQKRLLEKIKEILEKEPKLVEIQKAEKVIFVGDTHGDLEVSQKVIKDYLHSCNALHSKAGGKPDNKIVFLGDYVDRGPYSKENLDFLLEQKTKYPNQIFLLQGNHESHHILEFSPANFWKNLDEKEHKEYTSIVEKFPLVVVAKEIIALHGVLPDVRSLSGINQIKLGGDEWMQICWGDFVKKQGQFLGFNPLTGRPEFGRDWFFEKMERFRKNILIRSHQPDCPQFMFNNRCLTIFTSSVYTRERTIAIANLKKEIKDIKDLEIQKI